MKIINGEKLVLSSPLNHNSLYSQSPALFFVTEGAVYFGDRQICHGQGFFLSAFTRVSFAEDGVFPATVYKFELELERNSKLLRAIGFDLPYRGFNTASSEKALAVAQALCQDTYISLSEDFDTAAASLLLSLVSPPQSADVLPDYGNAHVNRVAEYIEENFASSLRVETLAELMGLDRMYLRNLFVKHTGMSTMEYIMNTRMTHAKRLLEDESMTVGAVANAVGYTDVLCFSKAFKNFTGQSPSEYRAGNRKREERKQSNQVPVFIL